MLQVLEALHKLCGLDADLTFTTKRSTPSGDDLKFLYELLIQRKDSENKAKPITLGDAMRHLTKHDTSAMDSFSAGSTPAIDAQTRSPANSFSELKMANAFFTPLVFQRFGRIIGGGMKGEHQRPTHTARTCHCLVAFFSRTGCALYVRVRVCLLTGEYEVKGERRIPLDMAAYAETVCAIPPPRPPLHPCVPSPPHLPWYRMASSHPPALVASWQVRALPSSDALSSITWAQLRKHFTDEERTELRSSLDPFWYCFDHVVDGAWRIANLQTYAAL